MLFPCMLQVMLWRSHESCGEVAVPRGLCGAPLRPGSEKSGGLAEAWLAVHLIGTLLVLLGAVVPVRVCVGVAVRYEILCGPGDTAVGQTHITFPVKADIHGGRRCWGIRWGFLFFLLVFTFDIRWLAAWLRWLSERNNGVQCDTSLLQTNEYYFFDNLSLLIVIC